MIIIVKVGIAVLNVLYTVMKLLPTKNRVVMISRQSNVPSMEFCMIKNRIIEKDSSMEVKLLCRTLDGGVESSIKNKILYCFHMLVQMYYIATSKVVILDSYCIVASILKHKESLKIIQMWHSMGTMKKFGYSILDKEEGSKKELALAMKMHQNYDYIFASADAYKDHLAEGFHCKKEKILTMPLPRLDLLQDKNYKKEKQESIYAKYPTLKEKPVILYCPTFRKDETGFIEAFNQLQTAIDFEKYNFVVKLHPLSKVKLQESVIEAKEFSSFDMLFVADYVISDYSCIVYEAAVLEIPLYFYNFDMELYRNNRGLAIDYEKELPGVISPCAEELIHAMEHKAYNMEELKQFSKKYIQPTENATQDIVEFIYSLIE